MELCGRKPILNSIFTQDKSQFIQHFQHNIHLYKMYVYNRALSEFSEEIQSRNYCSTKGKTYPFSRAFLKGSGCRIVVDAITFG